MPYEVQKSKNKEIEMGMLHDQYQKMNDMSMKLKWAIPVVIFLVAQTATAVWWASDISTTLQYVEMNVKEIKETIEQKWERRVEKLEDRIRELELGHHE